MNWKNIFYRTKEKDTEKEFEYILEYVSDGDLRYIFEETLFHRFNIDTGTEYKFYYDNFFQHLLDDTKRHNHKKTKKIDVFKAQLMSHMFSKQFPIIQNPGDFHEVRQLLRLEKLKNLQK